MPPEPDAIDTADFFTSLRHLVGQVADEYLAADVTPEDTADLLGWVYDVRRELQLVESVIATKLHGMVEEPWNEYPIPSGGSITFRGGNRPKRYDGSAIRSRYTDAIADEIADALGIEQLGEVTTGEKLDLRQIVDLATDAMYDATGASAPSFTNWRSGIAKRYGIKLKDYVTEGEKTPLTPVITGRDRT